MTAQLTFTTMGGETVTVTPRGGGRASDILVRAESCSKWEKPL